MSKDKPLNLPASIRQKLLNAARREKVDFQRILGEYVSERTLWRLQHCGIRNDLVFKGGRLISIWLGRFRGTRDIDFSAHRELDERWLREVFQHIADLEDAHDGLRYDRETIRIETIRAHNAFQGLRLTMHCYLEHARIPLQVDVGFNPVASPGEHVESIRSVIDRQAAAVPAYSPHAVIGEKLLAAVVHGEYNSRMKDFYDIVMLSRNMDFTGTDLSAGIKAAFSLELKDLPLQISISVENAEARWKAFLRKTVAESDVSFAEAKREIEEFINPCLVAMKGGREQNMLWRKHGVWEIADQN
jgi:predicted nucleotidyltransferase component of viral defense system